MSQLPTGISARYWSTWHTQLSKPVAESLEGGEAWIGSWSSVGLYEKDNKVAEYQTISVHLTTHRLILIPDPPLALPASYSSSTSIQTSSSSSRSSYPGLQLHLRHVRQTEFYSGFMRSSPKITLSLGRSPTDTDDSSVSQTASSWTCGVCGFVNGVNSNGSVGDKCGLCGVGYTTAISISSPASRAATPVSTTRGSMDLGPVVPPTKADREPLPASRLPKEIACPACTFLNHPSLTSCEICSTALPRRQVAQPPMKNNGSTQNGAPLTSTSTASPVLAGTGGPETEIVRLSFRRGGDKEAYRRLKNVLSDKAWERTASRIERSKAQIDRTDSPRPAGGIDGIMQSISLEARNQDEHMKDAFKDLEVLMVRAGEIVKLAQSLNAKLATSNSTSDEETTLIRSSLVQLGLPSPALTQDMAKDQERYHDGLARELGQLLTGHEGRAGLMVGSGARGVIGLDEVWGLWMRARGVSLLPPSTLMAILPRLSTHTKPPINLLVLPSSLNVLHTPPYAPPSVLARIVSRLTPETPSNDFYDTTDAADTSGMKHQTELTTEKSVSLLEVAAMENLPVGLAKELMESIEQIVPPEGIREPIGLVRDDQAVGDGGVRWYRDIMTGWEL